MGFIDGVWYLKGVVVVGIGYFIHMRNKLSNIYLVSCEILVLKAYLIVRVMVVCQFYQRGHCKFGDKCWNEHVRGGQGQNSNYGARQQLNFGGGGGGGGNRNASFKNSFGQNQNPFGALSNNGNNNYNTGHGGNSAQNAKEPSMGEILATITQEMDIWEKSGMWPFSCFSYTKETKSIPGLEDHSMEEVRLKAYEAQSTGTSDQYKNWINKLSCDYKTKKALLKNPSQQEKSMLIQLINEIKHSASSSGANNIGATGNNSGAAFGSSTSGLFSTGSSSGTGSAAFGSSTFGAGNTSSPFGGSTAGTTGSSGLFGKSTFGSSTTAPSGNAFGSSTFGSGSAAPASSAFGSSQQQASTFGGAAFSGSAAPTFGGQSSGPFGTASTTTGQSLFTGQHIAPSTQSAFSNNQSNTAGLFTKSNNAGNNGGLFGGQASQQTGGLFGKPSSSGTSLFGKDGNAPSASTFGGNISGASQSGGINSGDKSTDTTYTRLDQLTAEEKAAFEADKFELDKLPLRPPPRELCV